MDGVCESMGGESYRVLEERAKFPDGKLSRHDEGVLAYACAEMAGKFLIEFPKPIRSVGLDRESAQNLRDRLNMFLAREVERELSQRVKAALEPQEEK